MKVELINKTLILVMGTAASGKTTISKELLKKITAVYLDNNFFADEFSRTSRNDESYIKVRPKLYQIIYRITEENLLVGNNVLLDIPHITHMKDKEWRKFISDLVKRTESGLAIILCYCSESILKQRIKERGEERDLDKLIDWSNHMANQPIIFNIPFKHLKINTENNILKNISEIVEYIIFNSNTLNKIE